MNIHFFLKKSAYLSIIIAIMTISPQSMATTTIPKNLLVASGAAGKDDFTPLIVASTDDGNTWGIRFNNMPNGWFNTVSCAGTGANTLCAATDYAAYGQITNGYLAVSTDAGNSWLNTPISNLPENDRPILMDVSCSGSSNPICAAIGGDNNGAIITATTDGGNTWNSEPINGLSNFLGGGFNKVSCTGNGATALCVAAGAYVDTSNAYSPLLATSSDGGSTWNVVTSPNLPQYGSLNNISCTGGSSHPLCVATGGWAGIVTSLDGGNTWETTNTISASSISCTGSGASATCAAISGTNVLVSFDEGNTWQTESIANLPPLPPRPKPDPNPPTYSWNDISCKASNSGNTICVIAGEYTVDENGDSAPLLAVSSDGGNTWKYQPLATPNNFGCFTRVNCSSANNSNVVCTAVGNSIVPISPGQGGSSFPLLAVGKDNASSWSVVTNIDNLPPQKHGIFFGSSATN